VGIDFEARFVETGLSTVQLTNFRNFAHGRHVGLSRNIDDVTVLSFADSGSVDIADRTLDLLPTNTDVMKLESAMTWPISVLDLLVTSMKLTASAGIERSLNPGAPGVPSFGRRLYHLSTVKSLPSEAINPITRKFGTPSMSDDPVLNEQFDAWLSDMKRRRFEGIILDYDGTCCETWSRAEPPPLAVQDEIIRLMKSGLKVALATGRGGSVVDMTRAWLPKELWSSLLVGLYNGTLLLRLSDSVPELDECEGELGLAAQRLEEIGSLMGFEIIRRDTQVSVVPSSPFPDVNRLMPLIKSVLARSPSLEVKAVASGHSIDVIGRTQGKSAVLEALTNELEGDVLVIGDQGQDDGNDFDMLAATPTSLSVARTSLDPTRCWNLDRRGEIGPTLLVRYLKALQPGHSGTRFLWKS
jgi:hypothetical protein